MLYEVTVKKIVEDAVMVEADSVEDAKYQAGCQASDSNTLEILEINNIVEIK